MRSHRMQALNSHAQPPHVCHASRASADAASMCSCCMHMLKQHARVKTACPCQDCMLVSTLHAPLPHASATAIRTRDACKC
eukprot:364523-Chlamydomonas_euryale.AAC.10